MIGLIQRLCRLVLPSRTIFVGEVGCDDNDGFDPERPKRTIRSAVDSVSPWRKTTVFVLPTQSYSGIDLMAGRRV